MYAIGGELCYVDPHTRCMCGSCDTRVAIVCAPCVRCIFADAPQKQNERFERARVRSCERVTLFIAVRINICYTYMYSIYTCSSSIIIDARTRNVPIGDHADAHNSSQQQQPERNHHTATMTTTTTTTTTAASSPSPGGSIRSIRRSSECCRV